MNEWSLVWWTLPRLLIVVAFSMFYIIGGRSKKWIRRFIGGIFLAGSIILLSLIFHTFKWWILFTLAGYPLALSLPYGADEFRTKFLLRFVYGAFLGGISLIVASTTGSWPLGGFQTALTLFSSLFLGLTNPLEAVYEEALIASLSVIIVPFMV